MALYLKPPRHRTRTGVAILIVLLAASGSAGWLWLHGGMAATAAANAGETDEQKAAPVPVTVEPARKADFPVYLDGLGTVQPFDTVTVRSRVDGEVVKVAFEQGQM